MLIKQPFKIRRINQKNLRIIVGLMLLFVLLISYAFLRDTDPLITHKEANALFTKDKIEKLIIDGDYIRIQTPQGRYKVYKEAINTAPFFSKYPVEVKQKTPYLIDILFLLSFVGALYLFIRLTKQSRLEQLKQIRSLTRSSENEGMEPIEPIQSNVTFHDVAGIKDVKEELEEIIDFLRQPQKYKALDIRLPKGVLLVGPPGVGKTLISKAVAGEAGVPFFYQSGASFVHIYVGMGPKRVSELFRKAKQYAPSIVFIDEIDAVGKSRGEFRNDEREATLNQLLTEMDGFEENSGVIVIGATNKIDVLDEALLRPGRFDRRIHISLPDLEDRIKTLELYLASKPHSVNIHEVARMTVGFSSAALDTLTNEAAIHAMREGRKEIQTEDFEAVKDKVLLGKRKILSYTDEERQIQALYQGAKAVVATWLDIEFDKIGMVSTRFLIQDHEILSRSQIVNRIKAHLAGSIATKLHFNEQFTNASSDIKQAKALAHKVIYEYAMGDDLESDPQQEKVLLRSCTTEVEKLLHTLDIALKEITQYLLEHENITQEKCRDILRSIF